VIKERPNDLLFAVDIDGDGNQVFREKQSAGRKPLKSEQILGARSAVPAVDTRKRKGATTDGIIVKKVKRKDGISYGQLQRLRAIAYGQTTAPTITVTNKNNAGVPDYDPWGEGVVEKLRKKDERELEKYEFLEKKHPIKAPSTLKHKPIALSAIGFVPAVRLPEPGISYNPEFEEWDELLKREGEKEVEFEKKRLTEEAEAKRIQELVDIPTEEEESGGDWEDEEESEAENDKLANTVEEKLPKEAKRKTQAQRNKEKRQKELEREREQEKKQKQQKRELVLVKQYEKEIKLQERMRMTKAIAKMTVEDDEKNPKIMRKKRFGKVGYVFCSPTTRMLLTGIDLDVHL
jgi:nucleolar protein 53